MWLVWHMYLAVHPGVLPNSLHLAWVERAKCGITSWRSDPPKTFRHRSPFLFQRAASIRLRTSSSALALGPAIGLPPRNRFHQGEPVDRSMFWGVCRGRAFSHFDLIRSLVMETKKNEKSSPSSVRFPQLPLSGVCHAVVKAQTSLMMKGSNWFFSSEAAKPMTSRNNLIMPGL